MKPRQWLTASEPDDHMQIPSSILTLRDNLYTILASFLSGGLITIIVKWLTERKRNRAEMLQIHASTAKIEVETREASTRTIMAATTQIVELVDINGDLQIELTRTCKERDALEFELRTERAAHEQLKIASELREHFIQQLEAANKLGVQLRDLPPEAKKTKPG